MQMSCLLALMLILLAETQLAVQKQGGKVAVLTMMLDRKADTL